MRQVRPGTRPARAHVPQLMLMPAADARLTARGLAAMAVMNMADDTVLVCRRGGRAGQGSGGG
jgi:hypothetical protein